jgi:signal transduction histidine kinase
MSIESLSNFKIIFLYIFIFVLALICAILGRRSRLVLKSKLHEYISYGAFAVAFGILQILSEVINGNKDVHILLKDIPVAGVIIVAALIIAWAIYVYNKLKTYKGEIFSESTIKESLDRLPVGVSFSDRDGYPYLVNYQIDELSRIIFGRNVLNSLDFFDEGLEGEFKGGVKVVQREDEKIILNAEGRMWQIENIYHGDVVECLTTDITSEYELVREIRENNRKVKALNEKLKAYNKKIDKFTREKELLRAKRKIHDDIGRSLIFLRIYLENSDSSLDERKELINLWKQNIILLKGGVNNGPAPSQWERLKATAENVGINIKITGEVPTEKRVLSIFTEVVHESLNNAILHAKAKTLYIDIMTNEENYNFKITNNGVKASDPIVEKGGLKNIRRLIEMENGSMDVADSPEFAICITLPKGVKDEA